MKSLTMGPQNGTSRGDRAIKVAIVKLKSPSYSLTADLVQTGDLDTTILRGKVTGRGTGKSWLD